MVKLLIKSSVQQYKDLINIKVLLSGKCSLWEASL